MSWRTLTIVLMWAVLGVLLSSCAPRGERAVVDNVSERSVGAPAIVGGSVSGMEVRWWFASDELGRLGELLAGAEEATGDLRFMSYDALAANGVRVVRVPESEALALSDAIGTLGSRKRVWIPASGVWSEAYRGRRVAENVPVMIGGRRERLERGTLRMLSRAWLARTLDGPVLRADFVTQLQSPGVRLAEQAFETPTFATVYEQGRVIGELSFGAVLEAGYVYVITCEEPGLAWEAGAGELDEPEEETAEASSGEPVLPEVLPGPPARRPLTGGEVMFSARAEETGGKVIKSVVMVIPRVGQVR